MKSLQYTFTAGEVSPEVHGRIDSDVYQHGLAECQNFTVLPHGPVARRPGLSFCAQAYQDNKKCRLLPFVGTSGGDPGGQTSYDSAVLIELGDFYARFHVAGEPVLEAGPVTITGIVGDVLYGNFPVGWVSGQWVRLRGTAEAGLTDLLDQSYQVNSLTPGVGGQMTLNRTTVTQSLDLTGAPATPVNLTASRVYTVASPYAEADLPLLRWAQSPDFLTITHGLYAARELRRTGPTTWAFNTISFSPSITYPENVTATASGSGTTVNTYVVTALANDLVTESLPSVTAIAVNDLTVVGNTNLITWSPVTGATYYTVYRQEAGVFGYLGRTKVTSLTDSGQIPDIATSPPSMDILDLNFTAGEYPQAVTYFEQRRVFAATLAKPSTVWATRSGTDSNLSSSMPQRDDDALTFKVAAQQRGTIQHLVPLNDLLALTRSGFYRISASGDAALSYRTVNVKPQGSAGASDVQPVVAPGSVLYAQAQGSKLREVVFNPAGQGAYVSDDVTVFAQHLVEDYPIVELAYTASPEQVAWAVRSDGTLLGMTHSPEQKVYAWHRHETDGDVESVAVLPEGGRDVLYVVVKRRTGGKDTVRYIEKMMPRVWSTPLTLEDAFFVDAGTTYTGAAITTVTGLWHLEGRYVNGLADGAALASDNETVFVQNGQITLEAPATKVHVGLGYTSRMQTLPMTSGRLEAAGRGKIKTLLGVDVLVKHSSRVKVGQTFDDLYEQPDRTTDMNYDTAPPLYTGLIRVETGLGWEEGGVVCVQQDSPLPCTVLSVVPHVEMGD